MIFGIQFLKTLDTKDYTKVIRQIGDTPNIFKYTIKKLSSTLQNPNNQIKCLYTPDKDLIGISIIKTISQHYCELSLILILDKYRKQGTLPGWQGFLRD